MRVPPVADEVEELLVGVEGRRRPIQAVVTDRHDRALGGLEGQLGEPGGGEVGPDGRREVRRAPVPGPHHVAARDAEPPHRLDGARDVRRADVPEHPAHQDDVGRHVVGVPVGLRRIALDDPDPVGDTGPAAAARSRAKATRAGSSSTSSAETSGPLGWVATTSITSRPWPAHRLTIRIGPGWVSVAVAGSGATSSSAAPHHRLHRRAAAATGSTTGPRRRACQRTQCESPQPASSRRPPSLDGPRAP